VKAATAELVRYGNKLFVMAYPERHVGAAATREEAEASAAASFSFDGPAKASNPSFAAALKSAKAEVRKLVTQ
jgi:hypothetical protein